MNTEELEQTKLEVQNRDTAIIFVVSAKCELSALERLFSSLKTDSNQRKHHRNPEFCLLTSLEASSERENSGFSI
jgi:hypothetical protein